MQKFWFLVGSLFISGQGFLVYTVAAVARFPNSEKEIITATGFGTVAFLSMLMLFRSR